MCQDGVLLADPSPPARGSDFSVNQDWTEALEEAMAEAQAPGRCIGGQRILEVVVETRSDFSEVVRNRSLSGVIAWAVELDGAGRLLLVLSTRASRHQAEMLTAELQAQGIEARPGRFGEVMAFSDLFGLANAISGH